MLTISNLTYRIGGRTIIEDGKATIQDGWRVGIVGANGAGKSTLFKLISGDLSADGGTIELTSNHKLGVVKQDVPTDDTTPMEIVLEADEERTSLLKQSETETDPYKIAEIHTRLNDIDAYAAPARAATILSGLGFKDSELEMPMSSFSGGWRMRVVLAAALFNQPEVLLLDEPTNHLDLEAIIWLEKYLETYPHTLLLISHDRELLNKCVDHIVHVEDKNLKSYTGNYDSFEKERAEKMVTQQQAFDKQQAQRKHMQAYVDRFRAKASKAKQAQSRLKALERMTLVDAVMADRTVKFTFPQPEEMSPPIYTIDHVDIGYEEGKPVLSNVHEQIDMDDRIALLGANGNGKSTLIKLIAEKLLPMTGEIRKHSKLRIGYFSQHQAEELDMNSTPYLEMLRLMKGEGESKVRGKLGRFGFNKELSDSRIGNLSGGEKARLLFSFMSHHAPHLLLLDEPTNHLDMDSRQALVQALNSYDGAVVIVSHDPHMVESVADRLWLVAEGKCLPYDGDLESYRNYVIDQRRKERKADKKEKTEKPMSKKQLKQLEAQKRKKFPELYKNANDLEKESKAIAKQKREIETVMADPYFYNDETSAQKVQEEYAVILKNLEAKEAAWLEAQEAFDGAEV